MKNYTVTVNGNVYDVTVEEKGQETAKPALATTRKEPAVSAPVTPVKPTGVGSIKIEAGAAGKVFKIESSVGAKVKIGDPILVLEIMKMETPVVAPKDGIVASIDVIEGQSVETGNVLATINE